MLEEFVSHEITTEYQPVEVENLAVEVQINLDC